MIEIRLDDKREWGYLREVALQIYEMLDIVEIVKLVPIQSFEHSKQVVDSLTEYLKPGRYRFSREFFENRQCILYVTKEN